VETGGFHAQENVVGPELTGIFIDNLDDLAWVAESVVTRYSWHVSSLNDRASLARRLDEAKTVWLIEGLYRVA
jgi:hypothetical protein